MDPKHSVLTPRNPTSFGTSPTKSSLQLVALVTLSILAAVLIYETVMLIFNRILGLILLYVLLRLVYSWNPNIAFVTPFLNCSRSGLNLLLIVSIETIGNVCTYLAEGLYKNMDEAMARAKETAFNTDQFE